VAVLLRVRTGIHPEGFILKDKPCPYVPVYSPLGIISFKNLTGGEPQVKSFRLNSF